MIPNFFLVGAPKSGSTSLWSYLRQHPQIFLSAHKEPRYFAVLDERLPFRGPGDDRFSIVTDFGAYLRLFDGAGSATVVGEASQWYLSSVSAPFYIDHFCPGAKILIVLRDPIARAYSNFAHARVEGHEPLSDFLQAVEAEERRTAAHWSPRFRYFSKGLYFSQVKRYLDRFGRRRVHIVLHEDLAIGAASVCRDVFEFLEVDPMFLPDVSERLNRSGSSKSRVLDGVLSNQMLRRLAERVPGRESLRRVAKKIRQSNVQAFPPMDPSQRAALLPRYREDVLRTQDLIGRDLSGWLR